MSLIMSVDGKCREYLGEIYKKKDDLVLRVRYVTFASMRVCLFCQKEYEHKRESSKFCSAKCRVKHSRANPSKGITTVQVQVLYQEMLGLLENMKNGVAVGTSPKIAAQPIELPKKSIFVKSYAWYMAAKIGCQSTEDWADLAAQIASEENLSENEKRNLLKAL